MRKRVLLPLIGLLGATAAAGAFALFAWNALHAPLLLPAEGARLEVPSGASLRRVSRDLADRQFLPQPWLLSAYGRVSGAATRIHAGEYSIAPGTTPLEFLAQLVAGQVYLHEITIVEGWSFADLLAAVRRHSAVTAGTASGAEIMAELGAPQLHPEGQFFPDTYRFPKGTRDIELLRTAHRALTERLARSWEQRDVDIAIETPYEALILASIIEKETALTSEYALISGVFHERLRRGMRLQTDPTVIYGIGPEFDGNLRREDLTRDTPYNTYTRGGLPPTPIALPGGGALDAAVKPESTGALYFVATALGDGSHRFSMTLEEHEQAVADYLEQLRRSPQ